MVELKQKLSQLEKQLTDLTRKNKNLELRVEKLKAANVISSHVNDELTKELDGLIFKEANLDFQKCFSS